MIILSQRDPRWAEKKLGNSLLTVGRFGCTTTSIAMLSDYFGQFLLPSQIAATPKFYTSSGLIIWQNLDFDKFKFVERVKEFDPVKIAKALDDPNQAVILNVFHGSHWVVGIRGSIFGGYIVADPWPLPSGAKTRIKLTDITGFATFARK